MAQPRPRFGSKDDPGERDRRSWSASNAGSSSLPPHLPPKLSFHAATSPPGGAGMEIRRMSSELFSMDQEAESYLELERESVVKHQRTWVQKAKKALTEAHVIRLPSLPILEWLPKYPVKQQLLSDMNAGLACAVLLIPQGMAYGIQLGIPVIHGLYGAIFFGLVYVLFGTSKETCPANTALVTMMAASALDAGLPEGYSKPMRLLAAMHFTFFVGVVQIGLGIFRLGAIVHYVSYPVMVACNSAGIVITVISQLKHFLGLKLPAQTYTYQTLEYIIMHLRRSNWWELLVGLSGFFLMLGVTLWKRRPATHTRLDTVLRNLANLTPIIVMTLSTVVTWVLYTQHGVKMKIVGDLPSGFQSFPAYALSMEDLSTFATSAMTVGIVSFLLSYSAQKQYANRGRYEIQVDQELTALGLCNAVGSCLGGFVAVTGFARSAVNTEAGGKSQISAVVASVLVIVAVQWLGPLFYYIPMSGLAALLCGALVSAFDIMPYFESFRCSKRDFFVLIATAIVMLGVGIDKGIYCGIALSICGLLLQYSYPDVKQLGRLPGGQGGGGGWRTVDRYPQAEQLRNIRVLRLDEALTFVNGDYVKEQLLREARRMEKDGVCGAGCAAPGGAVVASSSKDKEEEAGHRLRVTGGGAGITPVSSVSSLASTVSEPPPLPVLSDEQASTTANSTTSSTNNKKKQRCHLFIVLDASGINFIDLSGIRALADVNKDLREHGVRLLIARAKHRLRDTLMQSERLYHDLGGEKMYLSLEEMVYLLERHDMRLHGTPFTSTVDLVQLGKDAEAEESQAGTAAAGAGGVPNLPKMGSGELLREATVRMLGEGEMVQQQQKPPPPGGDEDEDAQEEERDHHHQPGEGSSTHGQGEGGSGVAHVI